MSLVDHKRSLKFDFYRHQADKERARMRNYSNPQAYAAVLRKRAERMRQDGIALVR